MGRGPAFAGERVFQWELGVPPSGKTAETYDLSFSGIINICVSVGILLTADGSSNGRNMWASTAGTYTAWANTTCFLAP